MILIVLTMLTMLVIVVLAAVVVLYVAYPHRGQDVPSAPWVGDAMRGLVARLPTVGNLGAGHRPRRGSRAGQYR